MKRKQLSDKEYKKLWKGALDDPQFVKDVKEFIKITTNPYKLKDYGLEDLELPSKLSK